MKLAILILCLFVNGFTAFTQMSLGELKTFIQYASEKDLLKEHTTYLIEGYLFHADLIADKLVELKPDNANYLYRKGYTLLQVHSDYEGAIKLFEMAKNSVNNKYDMFSTSETNVPADIFYHLGRAYHLEESIDRAEESFQKFIAISTKDSELIPWAELHLLQCKEARKWMKNPVNIHLKNVGPMINTDAPEYSPVVALDGSALYFTSRRLWENGEANGNDDPVKMLPPEDVYVSYLDFDDQWTEPVRLAFCSPTRNEATSAVSTDERKLYLYLDSTGGGDIYTTNFYKNKFNHIVYLPNDNINTKYWESHCMASHDGKRIYFVSDRPGGYGGRDIYYCSLLEDGSWSKPVNMGPNINSAYDEDAPFISIDNKTLYFSTNGAKSIGGFDIVKTIIQEDETWSQPENLGYPFNSTDDDIFYTTTLDGLKGYMTSYRKNGYGEKDIYEVKNDFLGVRNIAVLEGIMKTSDGTPFDNEVVVLVNVTCLDCEIKTERKVFPRARDGFYISGLEPCRKYKIDYQNITDTMTIYTDSFSTSCDTGYTIVQKELILNSDYSIYEPVVVVEEPIVIVEPIVFTNLKFKQYLGFNKNKLNTHEGELGDFLKSILQQLEDGRKEITIQIYASASTVPTESFKTNEELAVKRAANTENALKEFFASTPYKEQVKIEVAEAIVQGPAYANDFTDESKYGPFQYVALSTK